MFFFEGLFLCLHNLTQSLQLIESINYLFYLWGLLLPFKLYFMAFVIQQKITIKYEITTLHWRFQAKLITGKKLLKKFFYNFIGFIVNHNFYVITFWMDYTPFVIISRRLFIFVFFPTKFPYISNCDVIYFFSNLKMFLISLTVVSSISFLVKRDSLILFSSVFLLFWSLELFIIIYYEKKCLVFLKNFGSKLFDLVNILRFVIVCPEI